MPVKPPGAKPAYVRVPRKRTLTDADLTALYKIVQAAQPAVPPPAHDCRLGPLDHEDADFIKDLIGMYKETRSEAIKWAVKGIVLGSLMLVALGIWFKTGRH